PRHRPGHRPRAARIAGGHPERSDDPGLPAYRAPTVRNGYADPERVTKLPQSRDVRPLLLEVLAQVNARTLSPPRVCRYRLAPREETVKQGSTRKRSWLAAGPAGASALFVLLLLPLLLPLPPPAPSASA